MTMKTNFFRKVGEVYKETKMESRCYRKYVCNYYKRNFKNIMWNVSEWYDDVRENPKELYNKPIRNIKLFLKNFKRSTKWFIRMWENQDYDHDYLIEMMVDKMKDMRYQFDYVDCDFVDLRHQPSDSFTGDGDSDELTVDNLEGLDKAIEIGERIIDGNYIHYTDRIQRWFDKYGYFNSPKMPEDLHDELMQIYDDARENEQNDRAEFFNIIRDNHQLWWS